ncbi:hypothetical protein ACWGMV_22475, partial [Streptomyces albidoflavus]
RAQLTQWDLEPLVDTTELLVSELVTNALRYGEGEIGLRLRLPWHGTTTRHAPRTPHEPGTGDAPGAQQGDRDDDG